MYSFFLVKKFVITLLVSSFDIDLLINYVFYNQELVSIIPKVIQINDKKTKLPTNILYQASSLCIFTLVGFLTPAACLNCTMLLTTHL